MPGVAAAFPEPGAADPEKPGLRGDAHDFIAYRRRGRSHHDLFGYDDGGRTCRDDAAGKGRGEQHARDRGF
jgi:hypothetical protein